MSRVPPQHTMSAPQYASQVYAARPAPSLSVSLWLLRNAQPLAVSPATAGGPPSSSSSAVAAPAPASTSVAVANVVECAEPGDLLYGCESDLLDTGTKPLAWGPQPALHHVVAPKYFCGEALSALLTVRNTSAVAPASQCRVRVELLESAQRRSVELLSASIAALAPGGMTEYRLFTRIVEPGIYSITARVSAGTDAPVSASVVVAHGQPPPALGDAASASAARTLGVECDRGVEEASRRILQLPGVKGPGSARMLVAFCLRNASASHPAALQHVALVSKDPSVTVAPAAAPGREPNATDAHMTELLRVPVCTGASAAACADSVMAAGEMRQFVWIVDVAPPSAAAAASSAGASMSTAAALALLSGSAPDRSALTGTTTTTAPTTTSGAATAQISLGVVEWQWRRSGGDGGALRSSALTAVLTAPASARAEVAVEACGALPSPCVVGEPCELRYVVTNRGAAAVEVSAHVEPASLLPDFLFVGGSTSVAVGVIEPQGSASLRIAVVPIQCGVVAAEPAFHLRDAAPPHAILWTAAGANNVAAAAQTHVVCMQAA